MKRGLVLVVMVLAGCIPRGGEQPPDQPPLSQGQTPTQSQATLQCHLDLAREDVQFRILPDRRFESGCSAVGAVQLTNIGVPTSNLTAMTCPLARQYARWVREAVQPAASQLLGTTVTRIETFGTYACRPVNNVEGARLSEHGFANAVDVSAFVLGNGRRVTVEEGWNNGDERVRRFLPTIHRGGCQRFSVGLGPDSDALHYNHLHFDLGTRGTCR